MQIVERMKEGIQGNVHSRRSARELCQTFCNNSSSKYVIFLVGGFNRINGGWMSIFSIAKETEQLSEIHRAKVAICTAINETPLRKYTKFDNDASLLPFETLLSCVKENSQILLHVPEYAVESIILNYLPSFNRNDISWHFNILLQNIDFIPRNTAVASLARMGKVTATVAHAAYANDRTSTRLGCPVHLLSTWVCPEKFRRTDYEEKTPLIVVSPDKHPLKREILTAITRTFPGHQLVMIENMKYRKYREIIQRAKFSITFGEGLDGYFVEPIFCGGIGLAIYNDRFFTPDYKDLEGIFSNPKSDPSCIASFMKAVDNAQRFREVANRQFTILSSKYVRAEYLDNLKSFYSKYFRD